MNKFELDEFKAYLKNEENQAFKGWDFSYLQGRVEEDKLSWEYEKTVKGYLKKDSVILDMGTGGGELLLSLNHPYNQTSVTEAYDPNIKLCREKLVPKGITLYPLQDGDDTLYDVPSDKFDFVLNHHESYDPKEVKRVLKDGGIFITQQVGGKNNTDLATFFDESHEDSYPNHNLEKCVNDLKEEGFTILVAKEEFPQMRFYDLGSIAYYCSIITWEFSFFSVERHFDKFLELNDKIEEEGFIKATEHRFFIIARKPKQI